MPVTASLVDDDDRFFSQLPRQYSFLEDQWMSFFARESGWTMTKADTNITFVLDERNQNHILFPLKDEFYSHQ